jgi:hypothetical protein
MQNTFSLIPISESKKQSVFFNKFVILKIIALPYHFCHLFFFKKLHYISFNLPFTILYVMTDFATAGKILIVLHLLTFRLFLFNLDIQFRK